jgi:hypothetical protein
MSNKRTNPIWFIPRNVVQKAVNSSKTFTETLVLLGFENPTNVLRQLKQRLIEDSIDFSHIPLLGEPHGRSSIRKSLNDVLVVNSTYNRCHLKKRLLKEKYLENVCAICGQPPVWRGKPLVLVLDHINGIHNDNRLENLRMICRNCDSQLETFSGRNKRYKK